MTVSAQITPQLPPEQRIEVFRFLVGAGALQFGSHQLKSGRVSPYFFNSGRIDTAPLLSQLGGYYAALIRQCAPRATVVFGPAYKGIPLCVSVAMALASSGGGNTGYLFDRKEMKHHGDQGGFVGHPPGPGERLVLVDDVITDGETKLVAVQRLREAFDAPIDALVIAFNRQEIDAGGEDAVSRFQERTGIPVSWLVSLADLEEVLAGEPEQMPELPGEPAELLRNIQAYRERYGTGAARASGTA